MLSSNSGFSLVVLLIFFCSIFLVVSFPLRRSLVLSYSFVPACACYVCVCLRERNIRMFQQFVRALYIVVSFVYIQRYLHSCTGHIRVFAYLHGRYVCVCCVAYVCVRYIMCCCCCCVSSFFVKVTPLVAAEVKRAKEKKTIKKKIFSHSYC